MSLGDDIQPEITAEWARNTTRRVLSDKVKIQLEKCFASIVNAINKDEDSASVSIYIHEKTEQILKSRGFKITKHDAYDQRESDYITIKW